MSETHVGLIGNLPAPTPVQRRNSRTRWRQSGLANRVS